MDDKPPYKIINKSIQEGKIIPFLGAGASLASRPLDKQWKSPEDDFLPKADELAEYLNNLSEYPSGESSELPKVSQYFDGVAGRGSLDDELHNIFSNKRETDQHLRYEPTTLHKYLAKCPANLLIVTTNYDDLLERAFAAENRPFDLVVYNSNRQTCRYRKHDAERSEEVIPNDFTPGVGEVPVIYKMHGAFDPDDATQDSYVITEDDYVDFLARMAASAAIPSAFARPFKRSHFLFLGYGLQDWNLRVILYKIWKDWPRRYRSWAIQQEASRLEEEFWKGRNLSIYNLSIETFLEKLQEDST